MHIPKQSSMIHGLLQTPHHFINTNCINSTLICQIAKVNNTRCVIQSPDWSPTKLKGCVIQCLAERKFASAHRQNEKKNNKRRVNLEPRPPTAARLKKIINRRQSKKPPSLRRRGLTISRQNIFILVLCNVYIAHMGDAYIRIGSVHLVKSFGGFRSKIEQ